MPHATVHRLCGHGRFATFGLTLLGAMMLSIAGWIVWEVVSDGSRSIRVPWLTYLILVGAGSIAATVMLRLRMPAGRIVAWCVLPFHLLWFPLGTLVGVLVLFGLHCEEMRRYLYGSPSPGGASGADGEWSCGREIQYNPPHGNKRPAR